MRRLLAFETVYKTARSAYRTRDHLEWLELHSLMFLRRDATLPFVHRVPSVTFLKVNSFIAVDSFQPGIELSTAREFIASLTVQASR